MSTHHNCLYCKHLNANNKIRAQIRLTNKIPPNTKITCYPNFALDPQLSIKQLTTGNCDHYRSNQ